MYLANEHTYTLSLTIHVQCAKAPACAIVSRPLAPRMAQRTVVRIVRAFLPERPCAYRLRLPRHPVAARSSEQMPPAIDE